MVSTRPFISKSTDFQVLQLFIIIIIIGVF